jgi:hypothetical protein
LIDEEGTNMPHTHLDISWASMMNRYEMVVRRSDPHKEAELVVNQLDEDFLLYNEDDDEEVINPINSKVIQNVKGFLSWLQQREETMVWISTHQVKLNPHTCIYICIYTSHTIN